METRTLKLSNPIVRKNDGAEDQTIDQLKIRKPSASDMAGLQVNPIAQGDINQLSVLLPRITSPTITTEEFMRLPYDDVTSISGVLMDFLLQSKASLVGT